MSSQAKPADLRSQFGVDSYRIARCATRLSSSRRGEDLDVPVGSVHTDLLPVLDQLRGVFYPDDGRQAVFPCDHGVMGFADPYRTVPEVARVLRPGGLFLFNGTTPWIWVAWGNDDQPPTREMRKDYFGLGRVDSDDPEWRTTEFQLTYGDWIRLFRDSGLIVEDLIELRPAAGATTTYVDYAPLEWARAFPSEHIWKVRKAPDAGS